MHSLSAILCLYMFMGLLACVFEACIRVLLADWRHGDVTITFSKIWEEEEARLIRREEKMGAIEEQALTIERRSLKRWGIWRTRFLKNLLSIIRNDDVMNEENDEAEGSRRSLPMKQIKVQSPTRKEGWDLFRRTSDDSPRFTPISIHEDKPEASIAKEKDSGEYKENGRSTSRDKYHLGHNK